MESIDDRNRTQSTEASISANAQLMSGMLLNHCLVYGGIEDIDIYAPNVFECSSSECAFITHRFSKEGMTHAVITMGRIAKFFGGANSAIATDNVLWLHVACAAAIPPLVESYKLPKLILKAFMDSSPFAGTYQLPGNAMIIDLMTVNMQDNCLNAKKLHAYVAQGILITFEQRTHAVVDENTAAEESPGTILNPAFVRGSSITTGSELNISNRNTEDIIDINSSQNHLSGVLFDKILDRVANPEIQQQIWTLGSQYLLFEAAEAMLRIAIPVFQFYSKEMLALHDFVFLRKQKPGYLEGQFLMEQLDVLKSCYELLHFVFQQSEQCVCDHDSNLNLSGEHYWDLHNSFRKAVQRVDRMKYELDRIERNLRELLARRNDRISLMLSIAATTFLPLSFLTGMFGMNFVHGGILVYLMFTKFGSLAFWALSLACVAVLMYFFHSQGFFEMLTTKEVNKQKNTSLLKKQYYNERRYLGNAGSTLKNATGGRVASSNGIIPMRQAQVDRSTDVNTVLNGGNGNGRKLSGSDSYRDWLQADPKRTTLIPRIN